MPRPPGTAARPASWGAVHACVHVCVHVHRCALAPGAWPEHACAGCAPCRLPRQEELSFCFFFTAPLTTGHYTKPSLAISFPHPLHWSHLHKGKTPSSALTGIHTYSTQRGPDTQHRCDRGSACLRWMVGGWVDGWVGRYVGGWVASSGDSSIYVCPKAWQP